MKMSPQLALDGMRNTSPPDVIEQVKLFNQMSVDDRLEFLFLQVMGLNHMMMHLMGGRPGDGVFVSSDQEIKTDD